MAGTSYVAAPGFPSHISPQQVFQPPPSQITQSAAPAKRGRGKAIPKSDVAGVKVKRKRTDTHEKREAHNAMEKERRIVLNGQFLELARLIPGLAKSKRPSKAVIVVQAANHISSQRESRLVAAQEIRALLQQRDALLVQINQMRGEQGLDLMAIPSDESEGVKKALEVENEVFGKFEPGSLGGDGEDEEEMGLDSSAAGELVETGAFTFSQPVASTSTPELSYNFDRNSIADLLSQTQSQVQELSPLSHQQTSVNARLSSSAQADFFPSFFPDTDPYDSPVSNPSVLSSFSHSLPSPHHVKECSNTFNLAGVVAPTNEKVVTWAAESLFENLQQQKQKHQQRMAEERGNGGGQRESGNGVHQQMRTSFSAQYGAKEYTGVSSKPQGIPSEGFSYCFPPSDPHPLPSPASSLSGSFSSSSPSNLENLANFGSWRDLGLGGQHGHSSHGLNNNAQQSSAGFHPQQHQHAIQFSSHPFSGFGGQVQHYQHSSRAPQRYQQQQQQQQQQPSGDDLREPTMDELREAVRIGMAHGASIAAAAGGERGGGAGGGGAWGYEHRQ